MSLSTTPVRYIDCSAVIRKPMQLGNQPSTATNQLLSTGGTRKECQSAPSMQPEGDQQYLQPLLINITHVKLKPRVSNLSFLQLLSAQTSTTTTQTEPLVERIFISITLFYYIHEYTFLFLPLLFVIHFFTPYHPLFVSSLYCRARVITSTMDTMT